MVGHMDVYHSLYSYLVLYILTKCFTSFLTDSIHLEKSLILSSGDVRSTLNLTLSFISSDNSFYIGEKNKYF